MKLDRNLTMRLLTGLIGGPIVLLLVYVGGWPFALLMLAAALASLYEFYQMVRGRTDTIQWMLFGLAYIALPLALAVAVREMPGGRVLTFTVLLTNWATDSGAYFCGRLFGKHKLAPRISPNKTIEGAIGGWIVGVLVGLIVLVIGNSLSFRTFFLPMLVAIAVICGDLVESAIKRRFAVKDAGSILPGHGGVLDRIDGTLLAFLVAWIYLTLVG